MDHSTHNDSSSQENKPDQEETKTKIDSDYKKLHQSHADHWQEKRLSANKVCSYIAQIYRPLRSVLDVGCGVGLFLAEANKLGADIINGVEAEWLDDDLLVVDRSCIRHHDLTKPLDMQCTYDLVISLEVGEHLPAIAAETYVASLVRHGRMILFSSAIPHQGGVHHVNEQWPEYWARLFVKHNYHFVDIVRPHFWYDREMILYIRQNAFLVAHAETILANPTLLAVHDRHLPMAMVHPDLFTCMLVQCKKIQAEYEAVRDLLNKGGTLGLSDVSQPDGT